MLLVCSSAWATGENWGGVVGRYPPPTECSPTASTGPECHATAATLAGAPAKLHQRHRGFNCGSTFCDFTITVSPHVVRVGDILTVAIDTVDPNSPQGIPAPTFTVNAGPGGKSDCAGIMHTVCHFRAVAPSTVDTIQANGPGNEFFNVPTKSSARPSYVLLDLLGPNNEDATDYYAILPACTKANAAQCKQHKISFSFSPASVAADGTGRFDGVVSDRTGDGASVQGERLKVSPPLSVSPKALVCSPHGRLYPTTSSGPGAVGFPFRPSTDAGGDVPFSVWAGSEPGDWFFTAEELAKPDVKGAHSLSFTATPTAQFPTDDGALAQRLYDLVRGSILGTAGPNIFSAKFGLGQPAADQALLLAFLQSSGGRAKFADVNFGPVRAGNHAGVVFYPLGGATGATRVLDTNAAVKITDAAGTGQPIPFEALHLPALGQWQQAVGAPASFGHLAPVAGEQLTYFGYPYPPRTDDGPLQASFYSQCLPPNPQTLDVEVHSPLSIVFKNGHGKAFGLVSGAKPITHAPGLAIRNRRTGATTYILPAGRYTAKLTGTGSGRSTVAFLVAGHRSEQMRVFTLATRAGRTGQLTLGPKGPSPTLSFGGHRYRATSGLSLLVRGLPRSLRKGHSAKITVAVRDQVGRAVLGALVTARNGKAQGEALTNSSGRATLTIRLGRGKVAIRISAPGALSFSATLTAR